MGGVVNTLLHLFTHPSSDAWWRGCRAPSGSSTAALQHPTPALVGLVPPFLGSSRN